MERTKITLVCKIGHWEILSENSVGDDCRGPYGFIYVITFILLSLLNSYMALILNQEFHLPPTQML